MADQCKFRPKTLAEREAGCPLDHCPSGIHHTGFEGELLCDCDDDSGTCRCETLCDCDASQEIVEKIKRAELNAGWDASP